ncbi:MAG: hypothetical protein EON98_06205 [Chitinophagaceae bacterium]|nr:MAG: hypothetical protein EON98_06205 [Chitinophagaceae bacterium]
MEPTMPTQTKPVLLLFDVYETLLDMEFFEKKVNTLLNSKRGYLYWFEMFMEYCFLSNSLQQYYPFTEIAKATLQMAGRALGETVSDEKAQEAIELFDDLALKEGMT